MPDDESHSSCPTILFRFVRPEDEEQLRHLYKECFPVSYSDDWFTKLMSSPVFIVFVAVCADRVIGVLVAKITTMNECSARDRIILDESFPLCSIVAYILSLGVTEAYRSRGIASSLLQAFLCYASGSHYVQKQKIYGNTTPSSLSTVAANQTTDIFQPAVFDDFPYIPLPLMHAPVDRTADQNILVSSPMELLDLLPPFPPVCYAIYLHVQRTNQQARSFYERRGFHSYIVHHGCYTIDGQPADGCTYVLHTNGGQPVQPSLLSSLYKIAPSMNYDWVFFPIKWIVNILDRFGQSIANRLMIYLSENSDTELSRVSSLDSDAHQHSVSL